MKDDNRLKGIILETFGVALFMVLYTVIGFNTFPIILILFPILFIAYGVKNGLINGILIMAVVSGIIGFMTDMTSGLLLFLTFAPMTIVIIYGIKNRRKSIEILAASSVVFFLIMLLMVSYFHGLSGINIATELQNNLKNILDVQVDMFKDMELTNLELLRVKDLLENAYKYMLMIVPSMMIIASFLISYINYFLSAIILRKINIGVINIPRFSKFKLPNNIVPGILIMFLGAYLTKNIEGFNFDAVLANLVLLVGFMVYIQGLAVIDSLMIKKKVKYGIRMVLLLISVFFTPLVSIISILGLLDIFIDFRKKIQRKS